MKNLFKSLFLAITLLTFSSSAMALVCVIKSKSDDMAFSRLQVAGLRVEKTREVDGDIVKIKREEQIERCLTPSLICTDGDVVFTVDIEADRVGKLPKNDNPNFSVVWREDALTKEVDDGEGGTYFTQEDWPEFEVLSPTEEDPTRIIIQGAGRIL